MRTMTRHYAPRSVFPWSEEHLALVKDRWERNWSAGQIAVDLERVTGIPVTRSMVLGRIHRAGFVQSKPKAKARPRLPSRPTDVIWSDELDDTLLQYRAKNTIAETARRMGISPLSVESRLRVLKKRGIKVETPPEVSLEAIRRARARAIAARATRVAPDKPKAVQAPPPAGGVPFAKLKDCHCRWPLWTEHRPHPDRQFYCGAERALGSWCEDHHRKSIPHA